MDGLPHWHDDLEVVRVSRAPQGKRGGVRRPDRVSLTKMLLLGSVALGAGMSAIVVAELPLRQPVTPSNLGATQIPSETNAGTLLRPDAIALSLEAFHSSTPPSGNSGDTPAETTPASITIFYDRSTPSRLQAARQIAARLQRQHRYVREVAPAMIAGPAVGYVFEQDRHTALALAVELGGLAGPVRQIKASPASAIPGTIQISLP